MAELIQTLIGAGMTSKEVAKSLGIPLSTFYRYLAELRNKST
jgi:hypothetical protein